MRLGECSVKGFVWGSSFGGDRRELVYRRDQTTTETSPTSRSMFSLYVPPFSPLVGRWQRDCKLTINGGLVFGLNRGLTRGTFKSPRPESTVSLRLTHIFYRYFSRLCSGDARRVFCGRIRLWESFRSRSSGIGGAPQWGRDRSDTSANARSISSWSVLPCNQLDD